MYHFLLVVHSKNDSLSGTVSKISLLPHIQCTWLSVTVRSPFSKR